MSIVEDPRPSRGRRHLAAPFFVSLACLCAALGACAEPEEPTSPQQAALDSALTTWADEGVSAYRFTYQRSCECLPEWGMPMVINVQDNDVVSVTYEATGEAVAPEIEAWVHTIDGLFGVIQDAIDQDAFSIDVTYDAARGYPVDIAIDYDEGIADEEFYVTVRDFMPLP